jgi:hypothetical protein
LPAITVLAACTAAGLPAQDLAGQELPEWVLMLSRVKRQARAAFTGIPNYACEETIQRFARRPRTPGFKELDTLRFEVAVVDGKELYARRGAGQFGDVDVLKTISEGAIGTGSFSTVGRNLFVYDHARVTATAKEKLGDLDTIRFDFETSAMFAGNQISSGGASANTAVRGSYWADAATLDIVRIEEDAAEIPMFLGVTQEATVVDYRRIPIGSSKALLPARAELTMANSDGRRTRNITEFSNCRQYGSESTIHFGEPETVPITPAKQK